MYLNLKIFNKNEDQGRIQEFVQGLLIFLSFQGGGGAQHPLGPENPQKSIDFTGPGGGGA